MAGTKILFDTNVLIRFLNGDRSLLPILEEADKHVSFLTEIELFCKPGMTPAERAAIAELLTACTVLPYTEALKTHIILLRAEHRLKMPDAFIAATAIHAGLPLFTFDAGFDNISVLTRFSQI